MPPPPPTEPPEHPGAYVQREILAERTTVTEAARRLGVGRPALSRFLNGRSSLSPKMAQRLQREFGLDAAHLHDMQTRFDDHDALIRGNAARPRLLPISVARIEADEIDGWAGEHQARQELAVLLRRLVHSTNDDVKRADFPAYGQAERPGWDGRIEAAASTPWIPEGASRWEFTCNSRPCSRANHYFTARQEAVPLEDRQKQTFVFLTPRVWPKKTEWEAEKRRLNEWQEVRAYDASDLEQWLETSPATQVWFAERLGRPVKGLQSLDQFWNEWAAAADPALSPALFAAAVDKHSGAFFDWLRKDPDRLFTIAADSRQEAIAFLACLLRAESVPPHRMLDRAVVLHRPGAVKRLNELTNHRFDRSVENRQSIPLLAIAGTREVEENLAAWRRACHCVAPQHRNSVGLIDRQRDIELDILTTWDFGKALASMNISGAKVDQLAQDTARSPTILRRRLSTTPESQRAGWTCDDDNLEAAVAPALVGAWNAGAEADKEALSLLANTDYEKIEMAVARLRNLEDPPVWCTRQYRGVCSRIDALFSVATAVTRQNLTDFLFLAEYILAERDPALDIPSESRWMAAVFDRVRNHSDALRTGIRETLILMAAHGNRLFDERLGGNTEREVETLVRGLLEPLTLETLLSHKDDLPDYAEAAPDAVLDLLARDLETTEPAAFAILKCPEGEPVFQSCPRTGLLWALESLAWLPNRLPRVATILAQLSEPEIHDRWINTPFNSLVSLFRTSMPQTLARLPVRLHALDSIVRSSPDVGWRLCVELLSKHHDTSHVNRLPKWRGDTSLAHTRPPSKDIREVEDAARQRVLNWPAHDEKTLGDLVDRLRSFPEADRSRIWGLIDDWSANAPDHAKVSLRDRIRKRYRAVRDERARRAVEALAPADAVARNQWLFASTWDVEWSESDAETSYEETLARVRTRREAGVREVLEERKHDGLVELVESCEAPRLVGSTLADLLDREAFADFAIGIVGRAAGAADTAYSKCLQGLLAPAEPIVLERLVQHFRRPDGAASRLALYLAMPWGHATWQFLEDEDRRLRESYWNRVAPSRGQELGADELHELIDRLVDAKRPAVALWAARWSFASVETKRLQRLLRALARDRDAPRPDTGILSEAVEHLGSRVDVDESNMVAIELAFLPQLRLTGHGIPNLQKRVLESPVLFVQAVALAFQPENRGEDHSPWRVDDPEQRTDVGSGAREFLDSVQVIPGTRDDGKLDAEELHTWLAAARKMCAELDRTRAGDTLIGEWLARASAVDGVARPRSEVADAIEWMDSKDVEVGFRTGARNVRGVTSRSQGGDQERALATTYRQMSQKMTDWPRTSRILDRVARSYEDEAEYWDRSDEVAKRLPSI